MHTKLRSVHKQTVDGETEQKMASAVRTESFVWTINEVELLLRLTLDYKESKLQERLDIWLTVDGETKHKSCGVWGCL